MSDPRTDKRSRYVFDASLAQLVGWSYAISVIEVPSAHDHEELVEALAEIEGKLLPFPHIYPLTEDWFWETPPGIELSVAQWTAYKDEAVWPMNAIRMIYGRPNKFRMRYLDQLVWFGKLHFYVAPAFAREVAEGAVRAKYLRRSKIIEFLQSGIDPKYNPRKSYGG